jgi:hypothetical protein
MLYLLGLAPATLPGAVLASCRLGWATSPRASPLQWREVTGISVPRHVAQQAARGVTHSPTGWALGYRADGQVVAVSDVASRQHVVIGGATGAGKTTVVRRLLDGGASVARSSSSTAKRRQPCAAPLQRSRAAPSGRSAALSAGMPSGAIPPASRVSSWRPNSLAPTR